MKKISENKYEINSLEELEELRKEIGSEDGVAISINFINENEETTETATFDELVKRYKENAKKAGSSISEEKKKEYEEKLSN